MKIQKSISASLIVMFGALLAMVPVHQAFAASPMAGIYSSTGSLVTAFPDVAAGSSVAVGDLDGDGQSEVVIGSPPGVPPKVSIYRQDATLVRSFQPWGSGMQTGINVAVGDTSGKGHLDIVVAPRRGAGPQVLIFSSTGAKLSPGFFVYAQGFHGGINLSTGDIDGDGRDEIITGAGPGGGSHATFFHADGTKVAQEFPWDNTRNGGLSIGALDFNGDGSDDLVASEQLRYPGDIVVMQPFTRAVLNQFRSFGSFTGGVNLSVNKLGSSPKVLLGAGPGGGPHVLQYDPHTGAIDGVNAFPFSTSWHGGVMVAPVSLSNGSLQFFASPGSTVLSAQDLANYGATTEGGANSSFEVRSIPTRSGILTVRIVQINLDNPKLKVSTITATTGDCSDNCPVHPLNYYVGQVNGFTGVNGSYFCPIDYLPCASSDGSYYWMWYNSLSGTFVNAYQNQFNSAGGLVAFDTANKPYFFLHANDWPGKVGGKTQFEAQYGVTLRAVLSNGPVLVYNRQLVVTASQLDTKQATVHSNRSGIGFKGDTAYLVVASGATVLDLGDAMQWLGLDNALNLDGGGSSALWFSGAYKVGPGRNIPNAVTFTEN